MRRSTGLAFGASETWFDQPLDRVRVWIAGDFDGDGDDDVAAGAGAGDSHPGGLEVYVSSGDDFAQETWSHVGPPSFSGWVVGDFDGDGLDDVSAPGPLGLPVFLSTGTEFLPPATWSTTFGPGSPSPSSGDFDGDGLDDIIGVQDTGSLVVYLSTGSAFAGGVSWGEAELTSQDFTYAGDVDGDGLADLLALHRADDSSPGRFDVYLSTGSSFSDAAVWLSHGPVLDELVSVGDFTGR